jgi:hypothetical protein
VHVSAFSGAEIALFGPNFVDAAAKPVRWTKPRQTIKINMNSVGERNIKRGGLSKI